MSFAKYLPDGRREHAPASVSDDGKVVNAGYDTAEGVQKMAMLVWNTSTLAWERATHVNGAAAGSTALITKRIDTGALVTYVGTAAPGTAEASAGWSVQKITFDAAGSATAVLVASGAWLNRTALGYA